MSDERAMDAVYGLVWTDGATQETVPATFAIGSRWPGGLWRACPEAAGLGGASYTVGAIVGTCAGVDAFPAEPLGRSPA